MSISASNTGIIGKELRSRFPADETLPLDVAALLAQLDGNNPDEVAVDVPEKSIPKRRSWWPFSREP